jgi:hypothetical protein
MGKHKTTKSITVSLTKSTVETQLCARIRPTQADVSDTALTSQMRENGD